MIAYKIILYSCFLLVPACVSSPVLMNDPELIGRHPGAMEQPTDLGKKLHTAFVYDDKIYWGYGDYSKNTGPIKMIPFDLKQSKFTESETTLYTEAVFLFRMLKDGGLYVPYTDPCGLPESDYARKNKNSWEIFNPVKMVHIYDIVDFKGKIYLAGAARAGPAVVYELSYADPAYQSLSLSVASVDERNNFSRFYFCGEVKEKLYVQAIDYRGGKHKNSKVFDGIRWTDGPDLLPDGYGTHTKTDRFGGKLIYRTGAYLYSFDGAVAVKLQSEVIDFAVYKNELFVLKYEKQTGKIIKTSDLLTWAEVNRNIPESASCFCIARDNIFIGTTDSKIYKTSVYINR